MNDVGDAPQEPAQTTRWVEPRQSPFLARFVVSRAGAPTPRGETTSTKAIETTDE